MQELGEEERHERGHAQREAARAEPADVNRDHRHHDKDDVGEDSVRGKQSPGHDRDCGGAQHEQRRYAQPWHVGLVHREVADHRYHRSEQLHCYRLSA